MKRLLILLLALVTMTALPGQPGMLLVGDAAAPPLAQLLLDQYPGATAAYSLRLLRTGYTGPCIEVRRASNNDTQNIGFLNGVLDTASLKTFCASTNCFVRTWFDQDILGFNAVQATTVNQPLIVSGGVVNRMNGQPAVFFDGSGDHLRNATLGTYAGAITSFTVFNFLSGGGNFPYVYDQGLQRYILYFNDNAIRIYAMGEIVGPNRILGQQYSAYALYNLGSSAFKINLQSYTGTTGTSFPNATSITLGIEGNFATTTHFRGNIQEFVTYRSNQSSNETGIRSNINTFYNIY